MINGHFEQLEQRPGAVHWTMALTGEITFISPEIEEMRGISVEEAKSQSVDQIHPPDSLRQSLEYFERFSRSLLEGRRPDSFHADLEYFHADGSTIWCEVMAVPAIDLDGNVTALRGVSVKKPPPS